MGGVAKNFSATKILDPLGLFTKSSSGGSDKPPAPVVPPPAAIPPTLADASSSVQAENAKGKAAVGALMSDTVKTSPQGLSVKPNTAKSSLLGGAA